MSRSRVSISGRIGSQGVLPRFSRLNVENLFTEVYRFPIERQRLMVWSYPAMV